MITHSKLLEETIKAFGDYLYSHPEAERFPESLINSHREMHHFYWMNNFGEMHDKFIKPGLKGIFIGTLIGRDLELYVKRYGLLFDRLFLREPISKLLLMAPFKSPKGFYMEMVTYLNVIMGLEKWLQKDIVILYPPFYLMEQSLRSNIVRMVENYYCDEEFGNLALTFTDRGFSREETINEYKKVFADIFCPYYIDLNGGINLFTVNYILKTIAQDIATAIELANRTNGIIVSCLERTTNILKYAHADIESRNRRISLPGSLEQINAFDLRSETEFVSIRILLEKYFYDQQTKLRINYDSLSIKTDVEEVLFYEFIRSKNNEALRYLKVPFRTAIP